MLVGTTVVNANSYDDGNVIWYGDSIMLIGMLFIWIVDTNAEHEYLFIMERSDNDVSEGASATE